MKPLLVPCDRCHGTAKMPLHDALRETLDMVPYRGSVDSHQLEKLIPGVTANAQINRLERLRVLGLVSRKRDGKFWRYSRK